VTQYPTVTVVIPCYNHADFLKEAIDSVLGQTHPASEIIVVDDGSSDNPASIVENYDNVMFIRQENQGLSAARNSGLIAAASGKVIFLDADDRLLPEAIDAGLACFARKPNAGFVYGGHHRVATDGSRLSQGIYSAISSEPYRDMLHGNPIGMHGTVMYDRSRLVEVGGFDRELRRCEDYDIYFRMSARYEAASHPTVIAEYRWHGGNMSSNHAEMLQWALRVHEKHRLTSFLSAQMRTDWLAGRQAWADYYAGQLLGAAKDSWNRDRRLLHSMKLMRQALIASPRLTFRRAALFVGRRLIEALPSSLGARSKGRPCGFLRIRSIDLGVLDRTMPISRNFGFDRGTPIDRYYIDQFLRRNAASIRGRVLEVGDDHYSRQFGGKQIERQDILHISSDNPTATITGDLATFGTLPVEVFDCIVLTQTLHLIYDMAAAVREMRRALKLDGVVLLTVPGISSIDRDTWKETWFWSLTQYSAARLFAEVFGAENVIVETFGNVYATTTFLHGLAVEEIDVAKLFPTDEAYPVIVTVCATKRE
jgi:glycosyltransferase involved in cell wall biosynthesis